MDDTPSGGTADLSGDANPAVHAAQPAVVGASADDPDSVPREHHVTITRAARYFVLGTPSQDVRECWFVLHGYGQLAGRFVRHFASVASSGRLIVAPEALSRFYAGSDVSAHAQARVGASWMTREDRLAEISDYVGYLDSLWTRVAEALDPGSVALGVLGFSQGAATACRWTALGTAPVRRLVLWGGSVPDDMPMNVLRDRLAGTPLTFVLGDADQFRSADKLDAQLRLMRTHDIPATLRTFSGDHRLDTEVLEDVLGSYATAC